MFLRYFSQRENFFDFFISVVFLVSLSLRFYGASHPERCVQYEDECSGDTLNVLFLLLWGAATIALWLRLCTFCMLSASLGPMIQMIWYMGGDIATFFAILVRTSSSLFMH